MTSWTGGGQDAIGAGAGDVLSIVGKLRELEARARSIQEALASLHPVPRLAPAIIEARMEEWRRLLRQSITTSRTVLQRVLVGRITFTPREDGYGYDFSAETRFSGLFTGIASPRPAWIPRGGSSGIEHPMENNYGAMLDQAYGNVFGRGRAHHFRSPDNPASAPKVVLIAANEGGQSAPIKSIEPAARCPLKSLDDD